MFINASGSPHIHTTQRSLRQVMLSVSLALVPAIVVYAWLFGPSILISIAWTVLLALGFEALFMLIRRRPVAPALGDGSALLTALLLGLALPPIAPWWLYMVGIFSAIVVAKQLYGGLGFNPFNPAMIGYTVLLISFPLQMTTWPISHSAGHPMDLLQAIHYIFGGALPTHGSIDTISGATPLDTMKTQLGLGHSVDAIRAAHPIFGSLGGTDWQWINVAILLGGLWLVWRRFITWHIPVSLLGGLAVMAAIFYMINPERYSSPLFHVFSGAAMLGAFFIATDPVTAATSNRGKLWFGAGIGILTYIIRTWGGYPDGIAFAVLLMNMAAPTIDYYTAPKVFGGEQGGDKS